MTKNHKRSLVFPKTFAGQGFIATGVKSRFGSISMWKIIGFKKFLFLGNTFGYSDIGSNEKEFLPLKPSGLCAVLSNWSKPLKLGLKLICSTIAPVLASEQKLIWVDVPQDR